MSTHLEGIDLAALSDRDRERMVERYAALPPAELVTLHDEYAWMLRMLKDARARAARPGVADLVAMLDGGEGAAYGDGHVQNLADTFGVSRPTVHRWMRDYREEVQGAS